MMLLESFLLLVVAVVFFLLGRAYEEQQWIGRLRGLGRQLDREIAAHRDTVSRLPR